MNSSLHCPVFDLHLSLYRLIKPDYETRMDFNIQIDELHKKGLLKNHSLFSRIIDVPAPLFMGTNKLNLIY